MKKIILLILPFILASCVQKKQSIESTPINVMSFNIRYDNPGDSLNNWKFRKERVSNAILFYDADILGAQEVLHNQLLDMQQRLPNYNMVGVAREDGETKGEYSALFFKSSRFDLIDSGNFWLSETPDVAGSRGWDGACERIATWAKLKDKLTEKMLFTLNTHFDHEGKVARTESVNLILNKVNELANNLPVVVIGDFNASIDSDIIKGLTDSSNQLSLIETRSVSPIVYGPEWSFHNFGKIPYEQRSLIDYIFVRNGFNVLKHAILAETEGSQFLSDHTPILTVIE